MHYLLPLCFCLLGLFSQAVAQEKKLVVATASMIADMADNISGGLVTVESIVPIGGDPHLHEPTPKDARLVKRADLVLRNGLTFEGWLSELIDNSGTSARSVRVTEGIDPISSKTYQNSADPHAWMDVRLGLKYIENIKNALIELAPEYREEFEFNYGVYKRQLEDLDQYIRQEIEKIPSGQRVLITSHDAFQYYGRAYGIRLEAVIGTSTEEDAETSDIIRLNRVIREEKIPAVFVESTVNPKLLEQLAADNKVKIGGKLYADSIGDENSPASTYLDMLKYDTDVIVAALSVRTDTNPVVGETTETSSGSNWWLYGLIGLFLVGGFVFMARS